MECPQSLYGIATFFSPLGDPPSPSQSFIVSRSDETLIADTSTNLQGTIDPTLDSGTSSPSSTSTGSMPGVSGFLRPWKQPQQVQRYLNDPQKTAFFNPAPLPPPSPSLQHHQSEYQLHHQLEFQLQQRQQQQQQQQNQQQPYQQQQYQQLSSLSSSSSSSVIQPIAGFPHSQPRDGSPFSSQGHGSSCCSALSPPGDSELYQDTGPPTPPVDYAVISPFKQPASFGSCWRHSLHSFCDCTTATPMSSYVNPFEVNPAAQDHHLDFIDADADIFDFTPSRDFSLQSTSTAGFVDVDFSIKGMSTPADRDLIPRVRDEITVGRSSYPRTRGAVWRADREDDNNEDLDDELMSPLKNEDDDGDDDEDFKPGKAGKQIQKRHAPTDGSSSKRKQKKTATSSQKKQRTGASNNRINKYTNKNTSIRLGTITHASSSSFNPGRLLPSQHLINTIPNNPSHPSGRSNTSEPLVCKECKQPSTFKDEATLAAHKKKQHTRPFVCIFNFAGCESNFASKNEWKRHVMSQHLLLHYWLCTQDGCAKTANSGGSGGGGGTTAAALPNGAIFNRKDLFIQHLKRMHTPPDVKKQQKAAAAAAGQAASASASSGRRRSAPASSSPANHGRDSVDLTVWDSHVLNLQRQAGKVRCSLPTTMSCPVPGCRQPDDPSRPTTFRGATAWDQRMEHVARHLERAGGGGGGHDEEGDDDEREEEGPIVFGGDGDPSLMEWAARPDVAVIVRRPAARGGGWMLNQQLKTGTGNSKKGGGGGGGAGAGADGDSAARGSAATAAAAGSGFGVIPPAGGMVLSEIVVDGGRRGVDENEGEEDEELEEDEALEKGNDEDAEGELYEV